MEDKHLILDLDSTVIFASFDQDAIDRLLKDPEFHLIKDRVRLCTLVDSSNKKEYGHGHCDRFLFVIRPHFNKFRDYICKHFKSHSIWTAGQFRYARAIEHSLFPPEDDKLTNYPCEPFLTREECVFGEYSVLKELKVQGFDLKKTLIVDDREDTFSKNSDNGLHIPRYEPHLTVRDILQDDTALLNIIEWFKQTDILKSPDVRKFNKNNIFRK